MTKAECRKCGSLEITKDWYITLSCKEECTVDEELLENSVIDDMPCKHFNLLVVTNMVKRHCFGCGIELEDHEFEPEYSHCISYCCGCCPSKNGFKGESCQKDWVDRQKGRPVGIMGGLALE